MQDVTVRLNEFLFNSGILGFFKILQNANKEEMMEIQGNSMKITKEMLENFGHDYIECMIKTYAKDTKWYTITSKKEWIQGLNAEDKEQEKILEEQYKFIKSSMESASYKSGYEILKNKNIEENPYQYIEQLKVEKNVIKRKEIILKLIEHLEKNERVYCMKDIIYTKINCFWSNVSFLNRTANKNDIEEEYNKVFVIPAIEYLNKDRKSDITCIQCGNKITKKEANSMSWLNDVGVDINRKKSGFWNFKEDTYICPICNLIYSCIPLGFKVIGSDGIFINNNESIKSLRQYNNLLVIEEKTKEEIFEKTYGKVINNIINAMDEINKDTVIKYEPRNIQVVKRVGEKDNQKYEFNMLSKDKLEILKKTAKYFKKLADTKLYQEVLNNVLEGRKQYRLIDKLLQEGKNIEFIKNIILIQLNCIGGVNVQNREERIEEMVREGEQLQKYFYINNENENKLKSYAYKLQGALKANNIEEFLKYFTLFYGSLGILMPNCEAVKLLIKEPEYFRILGYSYIYELEKRIGKNINKEVGGNKNEE